MTTPESTPNDANTNNGATTDGSAYASAGAVAGLARDIEALRRELGELLRLPARLDELAGLVTQLAEATATAAPAESGGPSWLDLPTDLDAAVAVLAELTRWLQVVYLRYPDAAAGLPDCWLWHPDVIEELLWLMHAWITAYHDENAPITAAGDWHDRYRPGVVRRITTTAGRCSLENHQPRDGQPPPGGPVVPGAAAIEQIATWWATHRTDAPPEPDEWQLATANSRRRPGARR